MTLATVPRYDPDRVAETDGHAVVVGASMAGLLVARVLADRYATVTVVERDVLFDEPVERRGTPQAAQPHGLLEGGRATIEDLFPGYCDDLADAGGIAVDTGTDVEMYGDGVELALTDTGRRMFCASRPLFELTVRRRLADVDGVTVRDGCSVLGYRHDDATGTTEGVRIRDGAGEPVALDADLIVDATGRASRTPAWLAEHGYPEPPLDEVRIDVRYGTVQASRPDGDRRMVFLPASHPHYRGGLVVPVEGGRWIVNLHGFHGEHPPDDCEAFRRFADGLAAPAVADLLDDTTVLSETVERYPIPSSRRYRYEDLDGFPEGLLVIGDAIASFNPIYAQGMTVAAFEALLLHHELAEGDDELAPRFFEAATQVVDIAWSMGVGPDFAFPETEGPRPGGSRLAGWYVGRLQGRARRDAALTEALSRVIQFEQPPSSLFRPSVLWRVLSPVPVSAEGGAPDRDAEPELSGTASAGSED